MDRRVSTDKKTTFFNQKEEQDDQDDDNLKDQVDLKDIKADFQKTQIISNINKVKYEEDWTLPTVMMEKIVDWESRIASYS